MRIIKSICDFLSAHRRLKELQAAHDMRAVLNGRLKSHNDILKADLNRAVNANGISRKAAKKAHHESVQAESKVLKHIRHQRREIQLWLLADELPLELVCSIQEMAEGLTDEEVLAFKKPKRSDQ